MLPKPRTGSPSCAGCVLERNGCGFSVVTGSGKIPLLALSEAPGEWEEREGRPLVEWAPSGSIFERALRERGIKRQDIIVTNVLRCRPNKANELRGQPYERAALDHCRAYLDETIAEYQPKVVLALGDLPFRELTGYSGITEYRGFLLPASRYPGLWVCGTYHPAFLLRGAMHLFGVFLRDLQFALDVARDGPPQLPETTYTLNPTDRDIRDFLAYVRADAGRPIAYDVETAAILGVKGKHADDIIQIQFSAQEGHALVLVWDDRGRAATTAIMATPNPKWDWNGRLFDRPLLASNGIAINGEQHDLMHAWQHLQPAFGSGKDDAHGEKGVPSRLMSLQSATSFFVLGVRPWKDKRLPAWSAWWNGQQLPLPLRLYGCRDVDYTYRCGTSLFAALRSAGLEAGYREHKYELCKALDVISAHGLPIDRTKQLELRRYTEAELARLAAALQGSVPVEVRGLHPKGGYTRAKYQLGEYVKLKTAEGTVVERDFDGEMRQCLLKPFNPSSPGATGQVGRYIAYKSYPMPTKIDDPTKGTTGKSELEKLAAEVNDPVLNLVVEYRQLRKTGMDYTTGAWEPASDGRVHPTFRPNTASGQLTASFPNTQQFPEHSELAKRAKEMVAAEPGHRLVKIDMRGFHSRMIGWLASDAAYYKLADFDVHSFVTAHFLRLQGADYLLELSDDELRTELGIIKRMHPHTRNFKVKRVVHGAQFGLGVRKLYRMYRRDFAGEAEAAQLVSLLKRLFPATFCTFPATVRQRIYHHTRGRLVSPFGHHRMFFDYDIEQATAYLPSNCAHCEFQSAIVRLHHSGKLVEYGCCNMVHDSLWFHVRGSQVDECASYVIAELSKPSIMLTTSPLGPFQCNVDVEVGVNLAAMESFPC